MHPRIAEVLTHLDTYRTVLEHAVAMVPTSLHHQRPSDGRWSVAEIVEHLAIVEGQIGQLLVQQIEAARAAGLAQDDDITPVVPTFDMAMLLDRSKPRMANESLHPKRTSDVAHSLGVLRAHRLHLRDVIIAADGLALGAIQIPYPGWAGTLNVYQFLVFLGGHEARHTLQVRETADTVTLTAQETP